MVEKTWSLDKFFSESAKVAARKTCRLGKTKTKKEDGKGSKSKLNGLQTEERTCSSKSIEHGTRLTQVQEKLKSNQSLSRDQPWTKAIARTCSPTMKAAYSFLTQSFDPFLPISFRVNDQTRIPPPIKLQDSPETQLTKKTSSNPLPDHPPPTLVSPFRAKQK